MKRLIALLSMFVILAACFIPANAVGNTTITTLIPDEEIAKEHGYTIRYLLHNGWPVPYEYIDEDEYIPNSITICTTEKLDISGYKYNELADFYGVKILDIESAHDKILDFIESDRPEYSENANDIPQSVGYVYHIKTANFYTPEEAKDLFKDYDFVKSVELNASAQNDDDIERPDEVAGDVNFDYVFDSTDYILVKRAYFGTYAEKDIHCGKADLNGNREIDSMDYVLLKRAYFGTCKI